MHARKFTFKTHAKYHSSFQLQIQFIFANSICHTIFFLQQESLENQNVELDLSQFPAEVSGTSGAPNPEGMEETTTGEEEEEDSSKIDPNAQYVYLSIRDNQQIRLKVPENTDPIAYAKEYLQSVADSEEMLT